MRILTNKFLVLLILPTLGFGQDLPIDDRPRPQGGISPGGLKADLLNRDFEKEALDAERSYWEELNKQAYEFNRERKAMFESAIERLRGDRESTIGRIKDEIVEIEEKTQEKIDREDAEIAEYIGEKTRIVERKRAQEAVLRNLRQREENIRNLDVDKLPKQVQRAKAKYEQNIDRFQNFPSESEGQIRSGRALFEFQKQLGPLAAEHQFLVDELEREIKQLEPIIEALKKKKKTNPKFVEIEVREYERKKIALQEIKDLQSTSIEIDKNIIKDLLTKKGSNFPLATTNRSHLSFRWNIFERLPQFEFTSFKKQIDQHREKAISEFENDGQISADSYRALNIAVLDMETKLETYIEKLSKSRIPDLSLNQEKQAKKDRSPARGEMIRMKREVVKFSNAYSLNDLRVGEEFDGGTIQELLAYMERNNYTFFVEPRGKGNVEGRRAIFQEMLGYMRNLDYLASAYNAQTKESIEEELKELDREIRDRELNKQGLEDQLAQRRRELEFRKDNIEDSFKEDFDATMQFFRDNSKATVDEYNAIRNEYMALRTDALRAYTGFYQEETMREQDGYRNIAPEEDE